MTREIKGFPFGIQYYRAPTPLPEEWPADLRRVRELGFTFVQVRPQWRWHERRQGRFEWDDLDRLFDLCAENGLSILFQFMLETAPAWLYEKHRCYRVDLFGNRILPRGHGAFFVGGWLPCFDHPQVRSESERFIRAAVSRYCRRENLLLWEAWNEPRSRPVGECCCDASLASYREYLRKRFGSIEAFNAFCGKAYGSFSEITPPPDFTEYTELALFRQWAMESVVDRVRWAYRTIRACDGIHPVASHVGACSIGQDILADSSDDYATARAVDFYGTSQLFFTGDFIEFDRIEGEATFVSPRWRSDYYILAMGADWMRSVSPYFWINEIYTNSFFYTTPDISPEDLRFRIWSYIAAGAKGVVFWQYRSERVGNESGCSGLVGIDGRMTVRAEACEAEAARVRRHSEVLRDFRPDPADVAIVYDIESDLISRIEETSGQNFAGNTVKYTYKSALKGAYALLWRTRIRADFVSTRELEKIRSYRAVYLPAMLVVDGATARILEEYVRSGGMLLAEEGLGLRDKRYWMSPVAPGAGLDGLFGVGQGKTSLPAAPVELAYRSLRLPVSSRRAVLEPRECQVLAAWPDGGAAIVSRPCGNGRTWMFGFHPGQCYAETAGNGFVEMASELLREAGVTPAIDIVEASPDTLVEWRIGTSLGRRVLFLLNYEPEAQQVRISLPAAGGLASDLFSTARLEPQNDQLLVHLPSREIACIQW
jgi:beta-galactosidase GanA